ncbi:MAG: heavy metal translocating P-type ATPase [Spirochaetota bacterium]
MAVCINHNPCSTQTDSCTENIEPAKSKGVDRKKENFLHCNKKQLLTIAGAAVLLGVGLIFRKPLHHTPYSIGEYVVMMGAYLLSGWSVIYRAVRNIFRGEWFDENFLMTIATAGAVAIHQLPEAVGVMLFFSIGEFFQHVSLERSRHSVRALLEVKPTIAHIKTNKGFKDLSPEQVEVGEVILVRAGEKIPLDGEVVEGSSIVDTSPLTGEPVPRTVGKGDEVYSGTINKGGSVTVKVTKPFKDSSISRVLYMVEEASQKKAETQKFITRFSKFYSPVVVFAAVCIAVVPPLVIEGAVFSEWIYRALVLLVISCPCALVISIPLGYFGGIGAASREGILVKGAQFLDALSSIDTVVFDKTGTLTRGVFKVTQVVPAEGFSQEEVMKWAALAESQSNHPIARSIMTAYGKNIDAGCVENYREIRGCGIQAEVKNTRVMVGNDRLLHREEIPHQVCRVEGTVTHVAVDGTYMGYIIISDEIKPDSKVCIQELKNLGIKRIGMFTGDNRYSAQWVAKHLGLEFFHSDLLPEQKVSALEEQMRRAQGGTAFVGDGINDAPVITRADVGVAMGSLGSDAAIETADVVIMTDSPSRLAVGIGIARKTRRIVWQNIIMALAVKGAFIGLGAAGAATMWEAVFADVGVAILAVFNAMRILRNGGHALEEQ